jgi:hypothetical protein
MNWQRTDFDRLECDGWVIQTFLLPRGTRTHVRYRGELQIFVPCEADGIEYAQYYARWKEAA